MRTTGSRWVVPFAWPGFALSGTPASAATVEAAGGSPTEVQAAVDAAKDGDVVLVPAGSFRWTRAVKLGTIHWGPGGPKTKAFFHLDNYREFHSFAPWGMCDGAGPYDLNDGVVHESGTHTGPDGSATLISSGKKWGRASGSGTRSAT